ncbi:MAG: N-acetylmuramoyl-L-alanine amidase [Deltaproteobacteria bacterium]|nr:N-acetylmuramoyl-L-alanine amidase [Deltaproteobacteria bacterium]
MGRGARIVAGACLAVFLAIGIAGAVQIDDLYLRVKAEYLDFLSDEGQKPFRHHWLRHIDRFKTLQKQYPKSARADDALYMAAGAYVELNKYSYINKDLESAVALYDRLAKEYPNSNLADDGQVKAGEILERLKRPKDAYERYAACVHDHPKGDLTPTAAAGMNRLAKYAPPKPKPTPKPTPVAKGPEPTPYDPLTDPIAQAIAAELGTNEPTLESLLADATGQPMISKIDHWSNPDYTRIVVEMTGEAKYNYNLLEKEKGSSLPRRLYLDVQGGVLDPKLSKEITIADGLLKQVRAGQFQKDVARVVLDIESINDFQIFPLFDPYRIVIDVTGEGRRLPGEPKGIGRPWLVVLDPGHGGKDPGAMSPRGDRESLLVLAIAKRVERELAKDKHIRTVMTRGTDVFIPLPGRTAFANKQNADLFVSIHINSARNRAAYGIETYHFAPRARPQDTELVAAENATAVQKVARMNAVLESLTLSYKKIESNSLATMVQDRVLLNTRRLHTNVGDRKVHSAPFYVLMGARMPAILVECGFITNERDLARMKNGNYQAALAQGIADGVRAYFRDF